MCADHPPSDSAITRRTLLGRVAALPVVIPGGLVAASIGFPSAASAAAGATPAIRSKICEQVGGAPTPSSKPLVDHFAAAGVTVHARAEWGAKLPPKGPLLAETPRFLLVHHTVSSNTYEQGAVPEMIRGFFNFHTSSEKGWNDVAYNFFVDRFGGVWEGRTGSLAGPVRGDATGGNQGFSQLVCMIGDFGTTAPTDAATASLARVLAGLGAKYGIDTQPGATTSFISRKSNRWKLGSCVETRTIAGHREMSQTSCPGDALFAVVRDQLPSLVTAARTKR